MLALKRDSLSDSEFQKAVFDSHLQLERELNQAQQTIAQKDGELQRLREIVGMQSPLPLHDLLEHMANGLDHMFNEHQCDTDGWETWNEARKIARKTRAEIIKALSTPSPSAVVPWEIVQDYLNKQSDYRSSQSPDSESSFDEQKNLHDEFTKAAEILQSYAPKGK